MILYVYIGPHLVMDDKTREPIVFTSAIQVNSDSDKSFLSAVPLYTSEDYCEQGKIEYCK